MWKRTVLCAVAGVLVGLGGAASGATYFSEDFNGDSSLGDTLFQQCGGLNEAVTFDGLTVTFPNAANDGRTYLRTPGSDYDTVPFIAEVSLLVSSVTDRAWFMLGSGGTAGGASEPIMNPNIGMSIVAAPSANQTIDNAVGTNVTNTGSGLHRIRLTWQPSTKQMRVDLDTDYQGTYQINYTYLLDGSDNGFDGTNGRLIFGGSNGLYADDFDVRIPEPATMALLAFGGLGVVLRRKRR